MITKEYIQGYVSCLDHLKETLESFIGNEDYLHNEGVTTNDELDNRTEAFEQVIQYISTVKENYKVLVQKLNQENQ